MVENLEPRVAIYCRANWVVLEIVGRKPLTIKCDDTQETENLKADLRESFSRFTTVSDKPLQGNPNLEPPLGGLGEFPKSTEQPRIKTALPHSHNKVP